MNPQSATRPRAVLLWLGLVLVAALLVHVGIGGSVRLSPAEVIRALFAGPNANLEDTTIIWSLRLPRAMGCLCIGAMLGIVGSAFQALFRNPLADPYIVGVSAGAGVGGALVAVMGFAGAAAGLAMMGGAFLGGMLSLLVVLALVRRKGTIPVTHLLLAGVVMGSMLAGVLSLVLLAAGQDTQQVLRWLLGSMTPMFWNRLAVLYVLLALGAVALFLETRRLNAFAVGEDAAARLGVNTNRLKWMVLIVGTAMTAAAVGTVGIIGFLGLVAPHLGRLLVGVDWRKSLPAAGIVGGTLLLAADLLAQHISQGEVPVGVVTSVLGAPFLLGLLRKQQTAN